MWVIDETGFRKQGRHSAGVARPDRGTAGRLEHGQIGVFLAYASRHGHAWRDRELSVPKAWTEDPGRCQQAGMPQDRRFAIKPALAAPMLARSLAAGVPAAWVTGDRVYGDDRRVRMALEARPQGYVLAVSGKEDVRVDWHQRQVKTVLAALPEDGWRRRRAGDGAKGPRWDDWRWLSLAEPRAPGWCRWLLVRRRVREPTDLAADVVYAPQAPTLEAGVRVAGRRWTMESCFEAATGEGGLDQYAVRSWTGWYRHITLALWALALLTVVRAGAMATEAFKKSPGSPAGRSRLMAFKTSRGLGSRCVGPSCAGWCGRWSGQSSVPPSSSPRGPGGDVGIRAVPGIPPTNSVGHWSLNDHCSSNCLVPGCDGMGPGENGLALLSIFCRCTHTA